MKKRNVTNYNWKDSAPERVYPNEELLTRPEDGLSIRTLFEKYRKSGQVPAGAYRQGFDQEIPDGDDPDDYVDMEKSAQLDVFEKNELLTEVKKSVAEKRGKLDALKTASDKKAALERADIEEMQKHFKDQKAKDQKRIDDANQQAK